MIEDGFERYLTLEEEAEVYAFMDQQRRQEMKPEVIVAISQFMSRCTLKPEEIQTFQACVQALQEAHTAATAPPAPEPQGELVTEA